MESRATKAPVRTRASASFVYFISRCCTSTADEVFGDIVVVVVEVEDFAVEGDDSKRGQSSPVVTGQFRKRVF